ncbi:hypothetical protein ALC62_15257 [Cyphomyrmex costatus]|uniref:HAT C-terminal dimerisation domain-containing protein n=1 Tax=Cyphomyrmex costatus TaxID=456900 RepID=A0A151I7K0_9HYME|nr:hypothetical protein ALC62_15257 [Cyphomyrmex costatus]
MSLASNCSFVNESTSNNTEIQVNDSFGTIERANFEEECSKRSYLDSTWFAPDFSRMVNSYITYLPVHKIVRKIEESYKSRMTNIKNEISKVNCVCTTDIWTSYSRRFMGITVHWIDEKSLKRISYAIACRRFSGSHSHDRIANMLNEIHLKYEITREKLIATVTDNGSNFVKAFKRTYIIFIVQKANNNFNFLDYIETYEDNQYERESTEIMSFQEIVSPLLPSHQRCASHTLHLVATNDQSSENVKLMYNDIMQKCSTLWKSARSPKKYEVIVETLKKALKRPVVTRWNSLFDCFKQLITLKKELLILFGKLDVSNLTTNDFMFIEEYVKCTEPIAEALDILQGEADISYGYLLPTIISAKNKLKKITNDELLYCKDLIPILITSLEARFANLFNVIEEGKQAVVAAATHPKFKLRWLRCLGETARSNAMIAIKNGITSCCTPSQNMMEVDISNDGDGDGDGDGNGFDFHGIGDSAMLLQNALEMNASEVEFQGFWRDKRNDLSILHAYPIIKVAFIKFNTLIPSSAPVERMFSFATMYDIAKFNRLTDENFEKRVLCKANNINK